MVYIMLADGFEEIEALTVCDVLRRGKVSCALVSKDGGEVQGAHGIAVCADIKTDEVDLTNMDAVVLPGGMPGVDNLGTDTAVLDILKFAVDNQILVCAICAAPKILGVKNYLEGKMATCYPGFEKYLQGADIKCDNVVKDCNIITSRGMGTALDFALEILKTLKNSDVAETVRKGIIYDAK